MWKNIHDTNRDLQRYIMMLEWIRKFDLRKAGICSVVSRGIGIVLHILVIANIIPYLWVNGGRTETFAAAKQMSTSSIVMLLVNILITLIASRIIPVRLNKFWGILLSTILVITLPVTLVGVTGCGARRNSPHRRQPKP